MEDDGYEGLAVLVVEGRTEFTLRATLTGGFQPLDGRYRWYGRLEAHEELTRLVSNNVDALPGRFETSGAVLGAMMSNDMYRRPDNYYELLAGKYRALTRAELDAALKAAVDPKGFTWVVVGDAKQVKPQLDKLGMPVEVIQPR